MSEVHKKRRTKKRKEKKEKKNEERKHNIYSEKVKYTHSIYVGAHTVLIFFIIFYLNGTNVKIEVKRKGQNTKRIHFETAVAFWCNFLFFFRFQLI